MYSLGQAARAVGKAKSTISRDVKSGKVSAVRNTDGSVSIDPAELHRVYPAMPATGSKNGQWNDSQPPENGAGTAWNARSRCCAGAWPTRTASSMTCADGSTPRPKNAAS